MRKCLVVLICGILASFPTSSVFAGEAGQAKLVEKIHAYVIEAENTALYGGDQAERKAAMEKLQKKYADALDNLAKAAAKDGGKLEDLKKAVDKFNSNVSQCATCSHKYRNLRLTVAQFEECRDKFCTPMMDALHKVIDIAQKVGATKK